MGLWVQSPMRPMGLPFYFRAGSGTGAGLKFEKRDGSGSPITNWAGSRMGVGMKFEKWDGSGSPITNWVWERDGTGTISRW